MKIQLFHKFEDIISVENLLLAWREFIKGKRCKPDVQQFNLNLIDNILLLHEELASQKYVHGGYYRVLKVAQTIADLDESPKVTEDHLAEAFNYRVKEVSE